jgi:thiol-disulfide isomerase/thioredoxin
LSFLTIEKRFFASGLLALSLAGCRCSGDDSPLTTEAPVDTTDDETAEAPVESARAQGPEAPAEPETGPPAPPKAFEMVTAEALKAKIRASGHQGTLVNAWASFCGPCKREIPMLEKLAQKMRPRGIDVVFVSMDEPADLRKAQAFLKERGVALTSYLAQRPLGAFKQGMNPRWPGMLPASFLFDANGTLRYYWGGEAFEEEVLPVLEAFAAGKPIEGESTPLVAPGNPQKSQQR